MPKLAIDGAGTITAIWSDELVGLVEQGEADIARVSEVEPMLGGWAVQMLAEFNGTYEAACLFARTFRRRGDALAAEVEYLDRKLFSLTDER